MRHGALHLRPSKVGTGRSGTLTTRAHSGDSKDATAPATAAVNAQKLVEALVSAAQQVGGDNTDRAPKQAAPLCVVRNGAGRTTDGRQFSEIHV